MLQPGVWNFRGSRLEADRRFRAKTRTNFALQYNASSRFLSAPVMLSIIAKKTAWVFLVFRASTQRLSVLFELCRTVRATSQRIHTAIPREQLHYSDQDCCSEDDLLEAHSLLPYRHGSRAPRSYGPWGRCLTGLHYGPPGMMIDEWP